MISDKNILGQIYICSVCGADLSIIKGGKGRLHPVCCNKEMLALKAINIIYVCPICFSEIMVIKKGKGTLEPLCCNKKMLIKNK